MVKKIVVVIILVLAGGLTVLWFLGGQKLVSDQSVISNGKLVKADQVDSDKDGLKDWEEELWGTDKNKADTDDDGTTDGTEVNNNRDPNKPGPNDLLINIDERLLSLIKNQNQSGQLIIDPTSLGTSSAPKIYSASDLLHIDNDNSKSKLLTYSQELAKAFRNFSPADQPGVMSTALKALENEDQKLVSQLAEIRDRHLLLINQLTGTNIPSSAVPSHLKLLNALSILNKTEFYIAAILTQPIVALENVQNYPQKFDGLIQAINDVNSFFTNQKISLADDKSAKIIIKPWTVVVIVVLV